MYGQGKAEKQIVDLIVHGNDVAEEDSSQVIKDECRSSKLSVSKKLTANEFFDDFFTDSFAFHSVGKSQINNEQGINLLDFQNVASPTIFIEDQFSSNPRNYEFVESKTSDNNPFDDCHSTDDMNLSQFSEKNPFDDFNNPFDDFISANSNSSFQEIPCTSTNVFAAYPKRCYNNLYHNCSYDQASYASLSTPSMDESSMSSLSGSNVSEFDMYASVTKFDASNFGSLNKKESKFHSTNEFIPLLDSTLCPEYPVGNFKKSDLETHTNSQVNQGTMAFSGDFVVNMNIWDDF